MSTNRDPSNLLVTRPGLAHRSAQRLGRGTVLGPIALAALLAACGGGGDATDAAASPAEADGKRLTLAAAPALPSGAQPVADIGYRCGNVALGAAASGEIEVPAGEVCVLQGTRVNGNLKLGAGSVLDARDVIVTGSVQGDGAASVVLAGSSRVDGSIQLKQGRQATIVGTRVLGDLQLESNTLLLIAQGNVVGGNIQVLGNLGGVRLEGNQARGNLQCKENQPAPRGAGNTAASIEDQCLGMQPAAALPPGEPVNPPVPPVPPMPPGGTTTLPPAVFAAGSNVECRDVSLGAARYASVSVPAGARCELSGTQLSGNLEVAAGATVDARDAAIAGSVQADGARGVRLAGGRVDGSLQIDRGGSATVSGLRVGGSVQLLANGGLAWLQALSVGGDIQLFDNRGGATLNLNVAQGNLQCKGNLPAPTGSGNRAASLESQCAGL